MSQHQRVLLVTTNRSSFGGDAGSTLREEGEEPSSASAPKRGRLTGAWLPDIAAAFVALAEAGHAVDIATIEGGPVPTDPVSFAIGQHNADVHSAQQPRMPVPMEQDLHILAQLARESAPMNLRFWRELAGAELLEHTLRLEDVESAHYDAIMFCGGHGSYWDFCEHDLIKHLVRDVAELGGYVAATGHGTLGLLDVPLTFSDDSFLSGRRVTGFSSAEEEAAGYHGELPFSLEHRLCASGAHVVMGDPWEPLVVVDGRLITGQNPRSTRGVTEALIHALATDLALEELAREDEENSDYYNYPQDAEDADGTDGWLANVLLHP